MPLMWKRSQIEEIVNEHSYGVRRVPIKRIEAVLISQILEDVDVEIDEEDIEIQKLPDRTVIEVVWRPTVVFPLGYTFHHVFRISKETRTFQ